jgi:hypothetical protein
MQRQALWNLVKGTHSESAEVQPGDHDLVELLLAQDGAIYFRHSYATLSLAVVAGSRRDTGVSARHPRASPAWSISAVRCVRPRGLNASMQPLR